MPRNGSGNYTLPVSNPVISGTPIQSEWANSTMSDVALALTNSLSRQGQGGMLAPFRFANGDVFNLLLLLQTIQHRVCIELRLLT